MIISEKMFFFSRGNSEKKKNHKVEYFDGLAASANEMRDLFIFHSLHRGKIKILIIGFNNSQLHFETQVSFQRKIVPLTPFLKTHQIIDNIHIVFILFRFHATPTIDL